MSKRIPFRVDEELEIAAKELAEEHNVSLSEICRHGLFLMLAAKGDVPVPDSWQSRGKTNVPLHRLMESFPIVLNWTQFIPEDEERIDSRRW